MKRFEKNFGILKRTKFLKKIKFLELLNELNVNFWLENLFDLSLIKKKKNLDELIENFKKKKYTSFFNFNLSKKKLKILTNERKNVKNKSYENFFSILSIDEYLKARKICLKFYSSYEGWKKKTLKIIEVNFKKVLTDLLDEKKFSEFFFLIKETYRFDFIETSVKEKKKKLNLIRFFFYNTTLLLPNKFQTWIDFLMNRFSKKKLNADKNFLFKNHGYFLILTSIKKIISERELKLKIFFKKSFNSGNQNLTISIRKIFDKFSKSGILNPNFFWCKDFLRTIFSLTLKIFTKKVKKELIYFPKTREKLGSKNIEKIKYFFLNPFSGQKIPEFYVKLSAIFGLGIILKNSNEYFIFDDFLSKYETISGWALFFTGVSLFFIGCQTWKSFKNFSSLLKDNLVSADLKGGIFFGIGLKLKSFFGLEKILKKNFFKENHDLKTPIREYGKILGSSLLLIQKVKDPKKSFVTDILLNSIFSDTLTGIAFSLSLGLIFLGSSSAFLLRKFSILIQETEHLKISKILVLSTSLLFFGKKEKSELIFSRFYRERDPLLRNGGILIQTLAYANSSDYKIGRRFLKILGTETDSEVLKNSVIGIGFIFFSKFKKIKNILKYLSNHRNPYVRYGACFAVALSDGNQKNGIAISILNVLSEDPIDFVRHGAYVGMGIIFNGEKTCEKKIMTKKYLRNKMKEGENSNFSKFGNLIGYSLTENSRSRNFRLKNFDILEKRILKLFLFVQNWFFLPLIQFFFDS